MTDEEPRKRKRGRPRGSGAGGGAGTVQALDRGLVVLETLARQPGATLSDLAEAVGLPPSTAHRILATLQGHGFTAFDPERQEWGIGIGAYRVGSAFLARASLVEAARDILRSLMESSGETANLGIPGDGHIVFIAQVESRNPVRASFPAGARSRMHASGIGKALLASWDDKALARFLRQHPLARFTDQTLTDAGRLGADLARIRERGWSIDNQERYLGMRCIAAPIFDAGGAPVAGLSVSGPAARFTDEMIAATGPAVRASADAVTERLGGQVTC